MLAFRVAEGLGAVCLVVCARDGCLRQDHYRQMLAPGGKFAKNKAAVPMPSDDAMDAAASGTAEEDVGDVPDLVGGSLAAAIPGLDPSLAIEDQTLTDEQMAALLDEADKQEVCACGHVGSSCAAGASLARDGCAPLRAAATRVVTRFCVPAPRAMLG